MQCYWCGEVYAGVHVCPDNEGDETMAYDYLKNRQDTDPYVQSMNSILIGYLGFLIEETRRQRRDNFLSHAMECIGQAIIKDTKVCPNTYLQGHCVVCGRAGDEGCPLDPDRPDCPACQDTGRVPTDDPLSPDGKAQCPECTIE